MPNITFNKYGKVCCKREYHGVKRDTWELDKKALEWAVQEFIMKHYPPSGISEEIGSRKLKVEFDWAEDNNEYNAVVTLDYNSEVKDISP